MYHVVHVLIDASIQWGVLKKTEKGVQFSVYYICGCVGPVRKQLVLLWLLFLCSTTPDSIPELLSHLLDFYSLCGSTIVTKLLLCVYVCVCVCVCWCVCVCVCIDVCMHYLCVSMLACICLHKYVYVCEGKCGQPIFHLLVDRCLQTIDKRQWSMRDISSCRSSLAVPWSSVEPQWPCAPTSPTLSVKHFSGSSFSQQKTKQKKKKRKKQECHSWKETHVCHTFFFADISY